MSDTPSYRLYRSANEMPLKVYKRILIEGDIKAMYVEAPDKITDEHLITAAETFYEIQGDYADALGDMHYCAYIKEKKDLSVKQTSYRTLLFAIDQIAYLVPLYYSLTDPVSRGKVITIIEGYAGHIMQALTFTFDYMDLETLEKNIKRCTNRSKSFIFLIELGKESIRVMEEAFKKNGKINPEMIDDNLINLSDAAGYRLTDDISLYEYGRRICKARKERERMELLRKGKKS